MSHSGTGSQRRKFLKSVGAAGAVGLSGWMGSGVQDDLFTEAIELVVPYSAGGGTDVYVQGLADPLSDELGQPVEPTYETGAGSAVGARFFHQSSKEDHSVIIGNMPHFVFDQFRTENAGYNVQEWNPLVTYTYEAFVAVQNSNRANDDIEQVMEKFSDGTYEFVGGSSIGGNLSMMWWLLYDRWGLDYEEYIVYESGAEMITAALNDEVALTAPGMVPTAPHIESGDLNAVMQFTEEEPHPATPEDADIPTISDVGMESLDGLGTFNRVFFGHPAMSEEQRAAMEEALLNILESDEVQEWAEEGDNPLFPDDHESVEQTVEDTYAIEDEIKEFQNDITTLPP